MELLDRDRLLNPSSTATDKSHYPVVTANGVFLVSHPGGIGSIIGRTSPDPRNGKRFVKKLGLYVITLHPLIFYSRVYFGR